MPLAQEILKIDPRNTKIFSDFWPNSYMPLLAWKFFFDHTWLEAGWGWNFVSIEFSTSESPCEKLRPKHPRKKNILSYMPLFFWGEKFYGWSFPDGAETLSASFSARQLAPDKFLSKKTPGNTKNFSDFWPNSYVPLLAWKFFFDHTWVEGGWGWNFVSS